MNTLPSVQHSYATELVRKAIHVCSLSIPIVYFFISKEATLTILIPLAVLFGAADLLRLFHEPSRRIFEQYVGWLLRPHELDANARRFNGATYVLVSAIICVALFPKVIVITAFAILIISDTSAALVGRKYGRHPFFKKSMEGASAFFLSALIVVAIAPKIDYLFGEYVVGVITALFGAVIESLSISIDDNLSIPIGVGAIMWLLYIVFLPAVNVYALDTLP